MPKNDFNLRRGEAGQTIEYTRPDGATVKMKADDGGIFAPKSTVEEAVLDGFNLPVARAAKKTTAKKSRAVKRTVPEVQEPDVPAETREV